MFTPHNMSHVTCHVSHVTCHVSKLDKVVRLISGGSVINRAYPVLFNLNPSYISNVYPETNAMLINLKSNISIIVTIKLLNIVYNHLTLISHLEVR